MLGALISHVKRLRGRFPGLYEWLARLANRFFARKMGSYPRPLGNEIGAVERVLHSSKWNMAYGRGLEHERLEADFAGYLGIPCAIAVNTGGMALQMSMRALGLKPGHEVVLQIDTCSATALSVMNAGVTPIFSDISCKTFMLSPEFLGRTIGGGTKAVIATHMWGNPEDMNSVTRIAGQNGLTVIEDACLALGAVSQGRMAGTIGRVGVFSFGCLKPIQAGEGGMIVTRDEDLARELRSLRHWGDRTIDYGERDTTQLSWNGRMSEIVAAVVREQLKGYPSYLSGLRDAISDFARFLDGIDGLDIVLGGASAIEDCVFTQVVLRCDERRLGCTKQKFREMLADAGIATWHANFEPINTLTFFKSGAWRDWILAGDIERAAANYQSAFPGCREVYDVTGIGISRSHFLSAWRLKDLKLKILACRLRGMASP